jgi:hypothetical protein
MLSICFKAIHIENLKLRGDDSILEIQSASQMVLSARSGHWYASQGMAVLSPICEFVFCVACARSTKNAAGAENPVPPRSDRTGHSRTPQQGTAVEFRVRTIPPFASAATEIFLSDGQLFERSRRLRLALAA